MEAMLIKQNHAMPYLLSWVNNGIPFYTRFKTRKEAQEYAEAIGCTIAE